MRLLCFFFIISILNASAIIHSQNTMVSIEAKSISLEQLFAEIERQANVKFLFRHESVDGKKTELFAKNASIDQVLNNVLPTNGLKHYLVGNNLIVIASISDLQNITISGIVTDNNGEPIPGVSVSIKGTTTGIITEYDGKYSINVPNKETTLIFSFIGYISQELVVAEQTTINITLLEDILQLEEVVVVGYGVQKKVNLTGSVSSIKGDDLKVTSTSTAQALQGRLPGVQITQNSGLPGSTSTIKVRGVGSIKSDNSPLIVVDGFIADRIDDIAAGDIESVSVLKDAASGAIYGSRAANGVILITTKRGHTGKMVVDVGAEYGFQQVTKLPDYLNSRDYAQKQNEQRIYTSLYPHWTGALAPENLSGGTDWFGYLYDNSAPMQNYRVGISGGSNVTKYAISLNFIDQEGLLKTTSYNRLNLRSNFDHQFNERVKLGVNIDLKTDHSKRGTSDDWFWNVGISAVRSSPTVPITFSDGSPGIYLQSRQGEIATDGTLTPNWYIGNNEDLTESLSARASVTLEIELLKGLIFKSIFNGGMSNNSSSQWKDKYDVVTPEQPDVVIGGSTINSLQDNSTNSYIWEVQELLTYVTSIGNHNISALAGFSAEKGQNRTSYVRKENFPNNDLRVLDAGINLISSGGNKTITAITSLFGQLNYDYLGKYLFQANVRRDGSSVFAPGNQFGVFPSFSAAWRLSEETFLKQNMDFLSNLKVRVGYGTLGNARIPSYAWLSTYNLTDAHAFGPAPQEFFAAYYLTQMPNENVKWETTTTTNLGIDIGVIKNKLNLTFDYYWKSTTDLLLDATIPHTAGYTSGPVVNIGEVENKGWELTVSWDDQIGNVMYGASVNMSSNKNKVVSMGGIAAITGSGRTTREGLPINSFWGYKTDGIFRTWDELNNYPHLSGDYRPGDWKFLDIGGPDGVPDNIIDSYDMTYLEDESPDLFYGINLYLSWKGIDFSTLINGEAGKYSFWETTLGMGADIENIMQYWFDNRAILNDDGNVISGTTPAMGAKFNTQYSDGGNLYNTSYWRIKNIQIGYTIPTKWTKNIGINTARIYFNAVNPFLFTDYIGFDPETTYVMGSSGSRGGSLYYPISKSYMVGINLKF